MYKLEIEGVQVDYQEDVRKSCEAARGVLRLPATCSTIVDVGCFFCNTNSWKSRLRDVLEINLENGGMTSVLYGVTVRR